MSDSESDNAAYLRAPRDAISRIPSDPLNGPFDLRAQGCQQRRDIGQTLGRAQGLDLPGQFHGGIGAGVSGHAFEGVGGAGEYLRFVSGQSLFDLGDFAHRLVGAYGWAFVHPARKLYYNMTITSVSVLIALLVGGIEILGIIGDQLRFHGAFWDGIASLGDHFGVIGVFIVAVFVASWAVSILAYRLMGYHRLEVVVAQATSASVDERLESPLG
jgi:hypothetical protein